MRIVDTWPAALAEFTAIKGVDVAWQTGWVSDRAAAFLALGRPVITEETGAARYLPRESGFRFVRNIDQAEEAVKEVLRDWPRLSKQARSCAVEVFDSDKESAQNPQSLGILPRAADRRRLEISPPARQKNAARFGVAKRFSGVTRFAVMADLIKAAN